MGSKTKFTGLALVTALAAGPAAAFDFGNGVELHGYGSQDYFQTSANKYMGADSKGGWDNNFLGLVGSFTLNDKSKVWAQLEASSTDATKFTWYFVDYQLTNELRAHVGRVKFPLGIYNEYVDTRFLQVSSLLPSIYHYASDFFYDTYNGVGLDYEQELAKAGSVTYQVFGGNTNDPNPVPDHRDRRMLGTRVTWQTPVEGLRFLATGLRTQVQVTDPTVAHGFQSMYNEDRWILSADYAPGNWDIKAEYASHHNRNVATPDVFVVNSFGYYLQVGRTVYEKWMPYVRYDYVNTDQSMKSSDSYYQKGVVVGLDYKINTWMRVRAENQFNRGYALPVANSEVTADHGARSWNLFVVGLHFMF